MAFFGSEPQQSELNESIETQWRHVIAHEPHVKFEIRGRYGQLLRVGLQINNPVVE